jgi:hypothetical protein
MLKVKIVLREFQLPSRLPGCELARISPIEEVFVVCMHHHGKWGSLQIVSPRIESPNNCQQLTIVDLVVAFRWS